MGDALTAGLSSPIADAELQSINFFNGRLLVSGDLKTEQRSRRLAIQRLGKVVGRGVVDGLSVSLKASGTKTGIVLGIEPGTAVSDEGAVLKLGDPVELEIVPPSGDQVLSDVKVRKARFESCGTVLWIKSPRRTLTGAKVLFLVADSVEKGRAPLVAMDMSAAGCNIDRIAEAVRFELVDLDALEHSVDKIDAVNARNLLADRLLKQNLSQCPEGVPLAFLKFDEIGQFQFLDTWSVRRVLSPVSFGGTPQPASKGSASDVGFWRDAVRSTIDPVAQARVFQFQEHLADHLSQPTNKSIETGIPPAASKVFPVLPPAGVLPPDPALLKELFPYHAFDAGSLPKIGLQAAALHLRGALEDAADPIGKDEARILKVYRIGEGDSSGYLFAKARAARLHAMEIAYDPAVPKGWNLTLPSDASGHPSLQAILDDLYGRLKEDKREILPAQNITVDAKEPYLGTNVAISLGNLAEAIQATNSRTWPASQVSLGPLATGGASSSVEDAIESLRNRLESVSGLAHVLSPGTWASDLQRLSLEQASMAAEGRRRDLNLFFEPGVYETTDPVVLSGFGNVRLQGAGAGTILRSTKTENVLQIESCLSCTLLDLSLQARVSTIGDGLQDDSLRSRATRRLGRDELHKPIRVPKTRLGLRGALSISNVPEVNLERIHASCVGSLQRASCAISIHDTASRSSRIVVRDVVAETGDHQVGILVVDADEVEISSCKVKSLGSAVAGLDVHGARSAAALLANAFLDLARSPRPESGSNVTRILSPDRNFVVALLESRSLTGLDPVAAWDWARAILSNGLPGEDAAFRRFHRRFETFFRDAGTDEASKDPVLAGFCASFVAWLASRPAVADRGIVVAGKTPVVARIVGNRISGAAIGVLVALSQADESSAKRSPRILARSVTLRDNLVSVPDLSGRPGQTAGILVGNAEEARIQDNEVDVADQTLRRDRIEAIRAWGGFGRRLEIDGNTASGHSAGVHVRPLAETVPDRRVAAWSVRDNVCAGAVPPVSIAGPWAVAFRVQDNFS